MAVQINVAANQAALISSIQAGVQAYNQRFANNNQINLNINARAFSQPLGRITGDVKDFEAALAASNARVIAFGASTAVLGGVIRSFKELATVTIDVEKNLADINRVFGLSTSQLQKFSTELFNVSKQTASTFDNASKAALEFSRQGLKAEETLQRTKDALTLTRLAGIGTANAVDALTSTVNGFAATGVTTSQILNKLIAVEQDFAVGAGDLAEALSRTGQAAQEAGVSLDQLNALVTSAQQSTARGGAVIGNALKTIFTRLQRTETLDQLEAFNIAVRDVQGNILPAVTILQNFAGAYKNLADAQRAQLSEQVAGVYQVNILKAIVNDLNQSQGVYAGALQRGASATNEAEIATAKLNKTLDALLSQTATSAQQLANNIGKVTFEPLARYGTEQLKSLVESMNEILEGEGIGSTFANGLLKGIRNILAGPGAIAAFFTLFKLIQNSFSFLTQALPQIAGITTETQNRKNIEQSILQIMQQQGPISQALAGTMGNQAAQAQLLLQLARQQTAEYQQQSALAKQLAAQLAGQGVKVAGARGLQVTRAGGYVPTATKLAEVVGAKAGGYNPGRVVPSPVGGVMNTAEDVKYIPGFAQPFINPPAGSKAGRAHRKNAINRTGVDPYMANGFIPNFAETGSIAVGLMPYPKIKKALRDSQVLKSGVEEGDLITIDSFKHFTSEDNVNFQKLPNESAAQYENRIIKYWNYNDNSKLASKGSAAIDGYRGNSLMEVKSGGYNFEKTIDKFYRAPVENAHLKINQSWNKFTQGKPDNKHVSAILVSPKFGGFIPNFAPPTSAIRVPWFRKFGNPAFDAIQPTLGISRANDTDTFRSSQFRSKAFAKAATDGDPNIFAPLYEDFIFKALQLVSQPKIKDQLIRGYVNQPGTDQKQSAFDAFLGDVGLEFKGFPKGNLTGSISKNLNDKYERYAKANPVGAAKIKESIIAFNEIGDKNQLPSDFGKNFSQLAGTSYSEMVKNNPDLVKGLSAETNMLLQRYVKDPAFLAMSAAGGFIPNFAEFIETQIDAILQPISKSRTIQSKQLFGKTLDSAAIRYLNDTSIEKLNKYLEFDGYMEGALGIDFPDRADKKFLFTKNKGFIPNFSELMKGYAFNDGRIYNDVYHSDAWDSIEGPRTGAIKYANYNGKLVYQAKNISEKLKQAFISRGASVSSFSPVQDVDAALRSGNIKEIQDKSSQLGAVQLSEGIKAIYENGRYTTFIKDDKSLRILGGITPDELKMFGGVDRFLAYRERLHGVQKWQSFANGFIPNFAYVKSMIARVIPNTFRSLTDTKGTAFSNTNIGIARQKSFPSYNNLTDEQVLSQAEINYPNLIMSLLGNNAFIPDIDAVDKQSAGAQVYSAANIVSSFGGSTANKFDQYNPFGGGVYKGNPELIGTGSVQGKAIKLSYANVGKLGRRWENSKDPVVKDAWANLQKYAKMKLINKAKNSYTGNEGSAFLNENSRSWYIDDIDKNLRKYSEILKTEYNNYLKSINRIGTYVDIKGSAEATLFGKDVNYMALRPDVLNKQLQGLPKFDWKNAANGIFYGDYKNNKAQYDRLAELMGKKWTYNNASKRMFLQSGGFIPNFAYKQSVMSLEESMSGNKAIFDTKPFPHIRNSSQPTFSSAIADHGGLGNALSDSMRGQKAVGLMNKGFIPNFADFDIRGTPLQRSGSNAGKAVSYTKINKAINDYIKSIDLNTTNNKQISDAITKLLPQFNLNQQSFNEVRRAAIDYAKAQKQAAQATNLNTTQNTSRFAKFSEGLSKASTAIAILGPTIAGFAEQAVFGNKKRTEMTSTERTLQSGLSTGLSAVSTGAGIGAAFGLPGAIVGGAAGALVGFVSALDAAKLSAEDLAEMTDAQKQNTQQNVSAGQKYIQAQEQYAKLLASGASSDKLELASKNLSDSFNQITDVKLADELSKTKGGVEALNSVLSKFETDKNILTAALSFAAGVKGGKVQGGVQIGERVKELKSIGLSKEQISQLQSFKLEKERITRYISGGVGGVSKINAEVVKESSLKTAKQISEDIAKSAIGNKGTAEEIKAFQESILQLLFGENKDELLKQLSSGNQLLTNAVEIAKKEANLLKLRNDLNLAILKQINDANTQLEQADFGRKLLDEINNFKFSLAEGILSPLSIASEKSKAQRTKAIAEGQDELTKLNLNFVKENQEKFLKLTPSSEIIQGQIKPALEKAQAGDFSGIQKILSGASVSQMLTGTTGLDPATVTDLKKAFEDFNRAIDKQKRNNSNQLQLLDTQDRIEQIRARTTEFQATLLQKQIQLLADQERVEATRKTNAELEIDAIERRMADQGNFLGRGVVGKAESKIALRNEVTRKKLIDLEISRSKSAQSDYQSLIEKQQINLTRSAAASELEGRPSQALSLREQARNLKSIDITNSETLSQAIEQLKTSSFADPTLDTERIRTLEKLKSIQNDITNGKLREEEITKRINAEELRNAKRSTSIAYGFKEGFDIIRDEADTGLNKLARDTPILFRDGMVDAIKATIRETDNLNDALLGIAAKFLDTFSTQLMSTGISKIISGSGLGNLFGAQTGGLIRAQSGMYISGTGSGDKYPALLENGEYVLNRNAVMAMGGPAALDTLNFSAAPRFATGGQFNKQFDTIAAMEANMTEMGLENSPLYKEMTDAAKQKAEEDRKKRFAAKQQRAAMIGSLVAAAATIAIGAGVSNISNNAQAKKAEALSSKLTSGAELTKSESMSIRGFIDKGLISPTGQYTGGIRQTGFRSFLSSPTSGPTWYQKAGNTLSKPFRRQTGGLIGSRLSDTVPGYMEGGLYNTPLIKKYSAGLQSGGSSLMAAGNSSSTVNNNTNATNSFNFNTTVQRDGTIKMGSNTTSYEQQDIELSKNLNNRIYAAVGEVIRKEKQFGGSLAAIRNS
jgi:TP901 family phage tail tape measure protein